MQRERLSWGGVEEHEDPHGFDPSTDDDVDDDGLYDDEGYDSSFSSISSSGTDEEGSSDAGPSLAVPLEQPVHAPPSASEERRRHPGQLKSVLEPWQRKQWQRRLGESWKSNAMGLGASPPADWQRGSLRRLQPVKAPTLKSASADQGLDETRMKSRIRFGPDRGKLIHALDIKGGYAVEGSTFRKSGPPRSTSLPPIDEHRWRQQQQTAQTDGVRCITKHRPGPDAAVARARATTSLSRLGFFGGPPPAEDVEGEHLLPPVSDPKVRPSGADSIPVAPSLALFGESERPQRDNHRVKSGEDVEYQAKEATVQATTSMLAGPTLGEEQAPKRSEVPHFIRRHLPHLKGMLIPRLQIQEMKSYNRRVSENAQKEKMKRLSKAGHPQSPMSASSSPGSQSHEFDSMAASSTDSAGLELQPLHRRGVFLDAWREQGLGWNEPVTADGDPDDPLINVQLPAEMRRKLSMPKFTAFGEALRKFSNKDGAPSSDSDEGDGRKRRGTDANLLSPDSAATQLKRKKSSFLLGREPSMRRAKRMSMSEASMKEEDSFVEQDLDDEDLWGTRRANKMTRRMSRMENSIFSAAAPTINPTNTRLFGATEHLLCASHAIRESEAPSILDTSGTVNGLKPPPPRPEAKPQLLALVVATDGAAYRDVVTPNPRVLVGARAVASALEGVGFQVTSLLGEEASAVSVKKAMRDMLDEVGRLQGGGNAARMVVYFAGRGMVYRDKLCYLCDDELRGMHGGMPVQPAVSIHGTASRSCGAANETTVSIDKPELAAHHRWFQPVVIADLKLVRKVATEAQLNTSGGQDKTDFSRLNRRPSDAPPSEVAACRGCILAQRVPGGEMSLQCNDRHFGILTYYFLKAIEGGAAPTVWAINDYIHKRLERRILPSLQIEHAVPEGPMGLRQNDMLFPQARQLLATGQLRSMQRNDRMGRTARFLLIVEADVLYQLNPFAFVTLLMNRIQDVAGDSMDASLAVSKSGFDDGPGLQLFGAKSCGVVRLHFPLSIHVTIDAIRSELRQALLNLPDAPATLSSLDQCSLHWCAADHCAVITGPKADRSAASTKGEVANAPVDASIPFVSHLVKHHTFDNHALFSRAELRETVSLSGVGNQRHVGALFKHVRLGTTATPSCLGCRIERLAITALEEDIIETEAVLRAQAVVRRYLTRRAMRSKLTAAIEFVRQHKVAMQGLFAERREQMQAWYYDFIEEGLSALESSATRVCREIYVEERVARAEIVDRRCQAWIVSETIDRSSIELQADLSYWVLRRNDEALAMSAMHTFDVAHIVARFKATVAELKARQSIIAAQFGERREIREAYNSSGLAEAAAMHAESATGIGGLNESSDVVRFTVGRRWKRESDVEDPFASFGHEDAKLRTSSVSVASSGGKKKKKRYLV